LKQLFSLLKISVLISFVILSVNAFAGDPYRSAAGAREAAMSYVCVMKGDFWSLFHNPAGLALNKSFSFALNYENRFSIKELGTRSVALVLPAGKTSIGAIYSHFGYSDFKRQMAGLSCGLTVTDKIAAGVQIDYFSEKISGEYNNIQLLTCSAGVLISATENLKLGINIFNPVPNSIRKYAMPSSLRVGAGLSLSKDLFAGIETEMTTGNRLVVRTGFEYEAVKNFWVRGGFGTANSSFSFGVGVLAKPALIDIAFSTHEKLGITSSISIIFNIKTRLISKE
jgi:hypothetical protein